MDDDAVLAECERGEDIARKTYEDALNKGLPADVRSMVERQYQGVRHHQDRVRQLRGAVSSTLQGRSYRALPNRAFIDSALRRIHIEFGRHHVEIAG
jgi:hypothetical protein